MIKYVRCAQKKSGNSFPNYFRVMRTSIDVNCNNAFRPELRWIEVADNRERKN